MSEENKSIGINKTKKHSYIARFSLTDRRGEQAYNEFLCNQRRLVIFQVKEYPGVAVYVEYLSREEFEKIYVNKTPSTPPRKKTLYEEAEASVETDTSEIDVDSAYDF